MDVLVLIDKLVLRNDSDRGPGIGFFVSTLVAQVTGT